jgi:hypothetical protein
MTLYYNNAASDGDWGNVNNWWQDDAFTIQASAIPTSSDDIEIYGDVTQNTAAYECYFNNANVRDNSQVVNVYNQLVCGGVINFYGTSGFSGWCVGNISFHNSSGIVFGYGTSLIQGNVTMRDSSRGGDVGVEGNVVVYYDDGGGEYPFNSNGQTITGTTTYKNWVGIWFFINNSGDYSWETLSNWNNSSDGSGNSADHIPWTDDGNGGAWYGDYDLHNGSFQFLYPTIPSYLSIDPNIAVSGTCYCDSVVSEGKIYGGHWAGDGFLNEQGIVYGGLFSGFITGQGNTNIGQITPITYGGTWTGDGYFNAGIVYGGTFSGNFGNGYTATNTFEIYGGTFTGSNFTNGLAGDNNIIPNGVIHGGTFTGSGFTNNPDAVIDGGDFSQVTNFNYVGGSITGGIPPTYLFPNTELHYSNVTGDYTWESLINWFNPSTDGNTYDLWSQALHIPWTDNGSGGTYYSGTNLVDDSGGAGITISNSTTIDQNQVVSASCNIPYITSRGELHGGTYTGNNFVSYSYIYGGSFSGDNFTNYNTIYGGIFSGNYFTDANGGLIYGGSFSGNNFVNLFFGTIYSGSYSGNNFTNYGYITGITFSGNGFYNAQGAQVANSDFTNGSGFSPYSVQGCYFNSDDVSIQNGHNYTYINDFIAMVYLAGKKGIDLNKLFGLPDYIEF